MSRTYTRLPLAQGVWQTNFIAIPAEFARAIRSSFEFANQGVVAFRLHWTGLAQAGGEPESKECFVGWSGAIARGPFLQVPQKLGELSGLNEALTESRARGGSGLYVNIYAVRNAEIAERVDVEPAEPEDWDVLSKHAGFVESQMLSQVCVVYPNQKFCVWVANIPVHLIVKSGVVGSCAKLANETQVVVAPKLRTADQQAALPGSQNGKRLPPNQANELGHPVSLRVQPVRGQHNGMVLMSPSTVELLQIKAKWKVAPVQPSSTQGAVLNQSDGDEPALCTIQIGTRVLFFHILVSNKVAHAHLGIPKASRYAGIPSFRHVVVSPASTELVATPSKVVLRRGLLEGRSRTLNQNRWDTILRDLPQHIPTKTVLQDGSWLEIGEHGCYKVEFPADFATESPCFAPSEFSSWTMGEDVVVSQNAHSSEDQDDSQTVGEIAAVDDDEAWSLDTLGGPLGKVGEEIVKYLQPVLSQGESRKRVEIGTAPLIGCYLHGGRGCGKSTLVRSLRKTLGEDVNFLVNTLVLDCGILKGGKRSMIQKKFEKVVKEAVANSPTLVILEDLDSLLPRPANASEEDGQIVWLSELLESQISTVKADIGRWEGVLREQIVQGEITYADIPNWNKNGVAFMATCKGRRSLRPALTRLGMFERAFEVPSLDASGRASVLKAMLGRRDLLSDCPEDDIESTASKTEGYSPADLEVLVERATHFKARHQLGDEEAAGYLAKAVEGYTPASLRNVKLAKSDTEWADVGGLDEVRMVLKETLELPFQFAELYDRSPQRLASGILLYGPPGCGKTLLAGAVASECGLNFISVKGPEVLNKYIGASEQAIRDLFARAANVVPCIIFFDEFDAVAPKRGNDSTGVTDRVVNQMLTFLDGVESRKGVYVLAATSRPDLVDPALLRPGRLDKQLYCGFPTQNERASILRAASRKLNMNLEAMNEAIPKIAQVGEEFTGADLQALLSTAQLLAVHDNSFQITEQHMLQALEDTRPSVSLEERSLLDGVYAAFRGDRQAPSKPDSGIETSESKQKVALM